MRGFLFGVCVVAGLACQCGPPTQCHGGHCDDGGAGGGGGSGGGGGGSGQTCPDPNQNPPNLADNPGFECGLGGWNTALSFAEMTLQDTAAGANPNNVHSGTKSVLFGADGGTIPSLWSDSSIVNPIEGHHYCMTAHARGKAASFGVSIRPDCQGCSETKFNSPITSNWVRVPPPQFAQGALRHDVEPNTKKLVFRVFFQNAQPDEYAIVDDVQVWESLDGGCRER